MQIKLYDFFLLKKINVTIRDICLSLSGFTPVEAATSSKERAHMTTQHSISIWINITAHFTVTYSCWNITTR